MVIECSSCHARYWINDSMIRGVKGARVRCRRCGVTFTVVIPGMGSDVPESADDHSGSDAIPVSRSARDTLDTPVEAKSPSSQDAGQESRPAPSPGQSRTIRANKTDPAAPFPDNVYSLETFRETRPKRSPSGGGYDISGTIRPWPSASPVEQMPEEVEPLPEPPEENGRTEEIPFEEPAPWKVRAEDGSSNPDSSVPSGGSKIMELSPSDRSQFQAGFVSAPSAYKRVTDIAVIYLLLMVLGGCGYLLVHSFSREIVYLLLLVLGGSGYLLVHFLSRMMD